MVRHTLEVLSYNTLWQDPALPSVAIGLEAAPEHIVEDEWLPIATTQQHFARGGCRGRRAWW